MCKDQLGTSFGFSVATTQIHSRLLFDDQYWICIRLYDRFFSTDSIIRQSLPSSLLMNIELRVPSIYLFYADTISKAKNKSVDLFFSLLLYRRFPRWLCLFSGHTQNQKDEKCHFFFFFQRENLHWRSCGLRNVTYFKIITTVTKRANPNDPKPMASKGKALLNSREDSSLILIGDAGACPYLEVRGK